MHVGIGDHAFVRTGNDGDVYVARRNDVPAERRIGDAQGLFAGAEKVDRAVVWTGNVALEGLPMGLGVFDVVLRILGHVDQFVERGRGLIGGLAVAARKFFADFAGF